MKKLLLFTLVLTYVNSFADVNEECLTIATKLNEMKAKTVDIKYSLENKYKAERCKYEILVKDNGATVNLQQESGDEKFKLYVVEKYSAWEFWK